MAVAGVVDGRGFTLRFSPWNRQLQAMQHELSSRVHLEMIRVPAHACNKTTAAVVLGSAAWVEKLGEASVSHKDLGWLQVVAWTDDVEFLPKAVELLIEEQDDLLEDDEGLVLPGDALIPLEKNRLCYRVSVRLVRSEDPPGGRQPPGSGGGRTGRDRDGGSRRDDSRRHNGHAGGGETFLCGRGTDGGGGGGSADQ
jgi:hypothetical protein